MESKRSNRKAFYMGLSILVAVVIWIFVDVSANRTVTTWAEDVPIEFTDEATLTDRGFMRLEEGTDTSISVELEGTRWNIAKLDKSKLRILVSLSGVTSTGVQSIKTSVRWPQGFPTNAIRVTDASAYMAKVNIGELNSKEIDIRPEYAGSVAEGYTAGELVLSPATLEIRGQAADIDPISYARVTINLDNAESTVSELLEYQFYDKNDKLVEKDGIHASAEKIQATLPVNVTKELPLTIDFVEAPGASFKNVAWEITPKAVTVYGDAEKLRSIDSISLGEFKLEELNGSNSYHYTIPIPDGCENLDGTTWAELKVSFIDMTSASVPAGRFTCVNVPEGKTAQVLTDELMVRIFGTAADVAAVTGENILVEADLSDFSAAAGSYTVPAKVLVETDGDVGVSGTYQVRVNIQEPPEETDEPPIDTGETP